MREDVKVSFASIRSDMGMVRVVAVVEYGKVRYGHVRYGF